jgi:transposase-like protein
MTKEPDPAKPSKTSSAKGRRKRTATPNYSAQEKVQAVLAVWTEKASPAQVSRQLSVNWITINQWQQRAMEGMLQALESRMNLASGEALSPRLRSLLAKRQQAATTSRLLSRLENIQGEKPEAKKAK